MRPPYLRRLDRRAAHSLMLGDPQDFVIVEADDWRTKEAKQPRDEAYAAKKIPLLVNQWRRTVAQRLAHLRIEVVPQRRPSGVPELPREDGEISIETATRVLAVHIVGATR